MDFISPSTAKSDQDLLRVLHLEDSKMDADLISHYLEDLKIGLTIERIVRRADYVQALRTREYDLILADYALPEFDNMDALSLAREHAPDTPFIFVSGALGEDLAVEALHQGATDFVLKEKLQRLPAAVSRAIEEARRRSEHRATQATLEVTENRLRSIFNSSVVGLSVFDAATGQVLAINDRLLELLGCTRTEFEQDRREQDALNSSSFPYLDDASIIQAQAGQPPQPFERQLDRPDGTKVWLRVHTAPMPGFPGQVVISVQDITARKQGEAERERLLAELRMERGRLEQVLEHMPVGLIVAKASSGEILSYNRQAEEILGHPLLPADQIGGYAAYGGLHEDGRPFNPEDYAVARVVLSGERVEQEDTIYRRGDGRVTRLSVSAAPVSAPGEPPEAVVCAFIDVDDHRRAEAALRDSEARFRALADAMPQLVWTTRPDGHHDYYNARWYDYTGTRPGETEGEGWSTVLHPDDLPTTQEVWQRSLETGELYETEYRLRSAEGAYRWFIGRALPMRDEGGTILRWYGTCTDIEEQKRTAETLAQTKERLRLAQEAAEVGTWEWDIVEGNVYWSSATFQLYGCDPASWQPSYDSFLTLLHPEDREKVGNEISRMMDHPHPLDLEFRVVRPDGATRWILARYRPEPGPDGRTTYLRGADIDVTEHKEAEQRERLLMREVDHRAKNTLAVVQSLVRLTRAETKEAFVAAIEGRVTAMARAHSLLARDKWAGSDLANLIEQELDAYAREQVHITGPEIAFAADAVLPVGLAMHELATNAAKYGALSTEAGRLEVGWRIEPRGGALVLWWRESGGPAVRVPTRNGFGSTLVRTSIEEQLGGRLTLDWRPEGLAIEMRIPARHLVAQPSASRSSPTLDADRGKAPRRVLVVEDNALIAMELEESLREFGCDVVGPALSLEDAELLATVPDIDAAVLDLNLHGQSSLTLATQLRARGVAVLICSGYEEMLDPKWADAPRLRKPFSRADLIAALRALDHQQ